ncbi:MAG: efflux RND transporter permease subunit [Deltaproteobacteria bacterium]|nr:efflux RND transporter permease subunit [Deltaproteobacteria bacterium]
MKSPFTRRPVAAIVLAILITLVGLLALRALPMALFPSVAPPEVNVTVEYTGANAEVVTKAAIVPLERAINGVPGMKYMSSDTGNDGVGVVQLLFETGTDPDVAAVNVQNRVSAVLGELPAEVIRNGVKIAKEENAMLMYLSVFSADERLDEKFLYNFADINILAELKRIPGVGYADILGAKEYAMRVWLKPERLVAYRVTPEDVLAALQSHNVEAAPGKLGDNSDRGDAQVQYTVKYTGKLTTPEQYGEIPIRAGEGGDILRIRDVADVELGTTYFDVEAKWNGRPAASILLKQLPGSNASEVIAAVKRRMAELKEELFLPGMDYAFSFDVSRFLNAAVREVLKTLLEAFLLVALVVFLFLQDWRSTLIPALAVPVSLIGTLAALLVLGFSLNLVTLFALVLSIGIVVDDAIVVVEAVHAKLSGSDGLSGPDSASLSVRDATGEAMGEIAGSIVAITLVMASVFVPLAFMSGPSGVFFRQFALTMAVAIALSGVVALTLTPALCLLFLKRHEPRGGRLGAIFRGFEGIYGGGERLLLGVVGRAVARRGLTVALLAALLGATGVLSSVVPRGFIPAEDQGVFYVSVTAPAGATLERTKEVVNAVGAAARQIEAVESVSTLAGTNILSDGTGASYGTALVSLRAWGDRAASVEEVMADLAQRVAHVKGAELEFFPPPPVPGYGNASGFELRVLDKTGRGDFGEMERVVERFIEDLKAHPEVASAFTIFNARYPQRVVHVDIDKAAQKGVTVEEALGALQTLLGSEYATNFIRFGQMYKVMVQALPEARVTPEDILKVQVRSSRGEMVPLYAFVRLEEAQGVDQTTRYNMYPSAEINGEGPPGVSSGQVLAAVQEVARESLPRGFAIDWAGISRDEVNASREGLVIFLVCLVFVYLVLCAKYESFSLPLVVIFSLPPGLFGAFALLWAAGLENNIYTQITLVMLIGLLGKNAILVVEFAEQRSRELGDAAAAVREACRQRLRPILMTSIAFIAGLLPLALSSGAGAAGNRTIGCAAIGGMALGTALGFLALPGLYVALRARGAGAEAPSAGRGEEGAHV